MATSSLEKDFIIKNIDAFERYQKDLENKKTKRKIKPSPSLEYGKKKLKHSSSR